MSEVFHLMVRPYSSVLSVIFLFAISCSKTDVANPEHTFHVFEENGVSIAETRGGPKYTEELFQYEQILVLHEDPQREESLLFGPNHFFMDDDGFFYVADTRDGRIVVFDPEGQYSHSFGQKGSGPGEFRQIEIQSIQNGMVSIWDFAQRRTTRFYTDGRLHDVTPLPISTARQILGLFHLPNERLLVLTLDTPVEEDRWEYEKSHATCFSSLRDSLWSLDFGWVKSRFLSTESADGIEYQWPAWYHYGPRPWCTYDFQGRIYYTDGIESVVDIYDLNGNHVLQIQLGLKPENPTSNDEDRARSFLRTQAEQSADTPGQDRWKSDLNKIRLPGQKALWQGINVDDTGYIWLVKSEHRYAIMDDTIPTFSYFIISPEGEYLGKTQRFKDGRIRISRGHMLLIRSDRESGERSLLVYAIRPAVAGLKYPK